MKYTDLQLKQALVKILSNTLDFVNRPGIFQGIQWKNTNVEVKHTELLYLCWLAEETLFMNTVDWAGYRNLLIQTVARTSHNTFPSVYLHATWQQRIVALAKVKGLEV